jgi:hypothetical protein
LPGDDEHGVFRAASDILDPAGNVLVTAYALERPDGQWSLLLINKDQTHPQKVSVVFQNDASSRNGYFEGPVAVTTFGSAQYQWYPDVKGGWADPDGPPARSSISATADTMYELPAASINVLRGNRRAR